VNTLNKLTLLTVVIVLVVGSTYPAYPQSKELIQLQRDVLDLKNTLNGMQASVDQKNQAILALVEKITDQVNSLAGSIQKVNQTVDNVNTHTDKSTTDVRGQIQTLTTKVNDLTDSVAAIRSQLSGLSQQMTAQKTEPLAGPDDSWRAASLDMTVGNYDLAIQELSDFQNKYPTDTRSAKAQLFKGNALFAQKKWDPAIIEYDTFLQKYPENDDTKTALYKKGLAQAETDPKAATATLQQVVTKYKGTVEATDAQNKLKELATAGARGRRGPGRQN
jgi:TolA-binding protein